MAWIKVEDLKTGKTVKLINMDDKTCEQIDLLANQLESTRKGDRKKKSGIQVHVNYDNALI